ncbi:hypothetical protein DNJ72_05480 [Prochlorococcus marinus XMU1403]|uniref:hypothetical protein n=1 Tax=Prochlorococcus marinus TaxID=1219 RepID=UPI000D98B40C|nr:hypothetical protein [Prochlorococcus marinus]MBW3049556.1 hypothetical protein [Prochlorococcus marinus str. MU1403]PYE01789.1 hypothetical protein DNJ72_05480 [Prochlorococcus marinus XMU1403]
MLLAAFEPGKEMAIANFSLAIFCLFTVALPLILITRGDKTEANRQFLAATVNPWAQVVKEAEVAQVVLSEVTSSVKTEPYLELVSERNIEPIPESGEVISLEINGSDELDESSPELLPTDDELLAA